MALTSTTRRNGVVRLWKHGEGALTGVGEITLGATGDYGATGVVLTAAEARKLGFNVIHFAAGISVRQSGGTLRAIRGIWDAPNNAIRLFKGAAGVDVEITAGTDLAAGDIITCWLAGN